MRYKTLLPVVASIGVLAACSDRQTSITAPAVFEASVTAAVTAATTTEFEGLIHFCSGTPPAARLTNGGTLHLRDAQNLNQWVTGNALLDGFVENLIDANINLKTGTGVAHLQLTLSPDAVDGTWEIRQTQKVREGSPPINTGVGHGTGELQGMTIKFEALPAGFGLNTCNPNLASARVQGVIISPATSD